MPEPKRHLKEMVRSDFDEPIVARREKSYL